ncbi:MAG: dephospho-CoA kinase [Burkholderiaceae bacterium]|nr:dephospho-CoA kinase [Burkholderiaceae bacterium]MDP1968016.1 dephospho-CoA kinase [Burkholderiaceae bacterium]
MALRIGLTGGIGSGKSTVAAMLAAEGAAVIDADAIARSVTAVGGVAIAPIASEFGPGFITAAGALDRDRMRELAYADTTARKRLEAIVHPLVGEETERQSAQALARGSRCLVFDIPLLVEGGRWRQRLDQVLVVDCPEETQVARVMARSGLTREAVLAIIASQASRAQRLAAADVVIYNEGLSLDALRAEALAAARRFGL